MASTPQTFSKSTPDAVVQGGFRPLLYTVATGSYTSNLVYGLGAPEINNYQLLQLPRGTTYTPLIGASFVTSTEGCDFQKTDKKTDFTCSIVLNAQLSDPAFFGTEELRIRPFPRDTTEPNRYLNPLPLPIGLPLFEDVEITDKFGVQTVPDGGPAGTYKLQARLLQDGQLALVLKDLTTTPPTIRGLQHADIASLFDTPEEVIRINIRGTYKALI